RSALFPYTTLFRSIRRREEQADACAVATHPEHGAFRCGRVHHRPYVVHRRLERLNLSHAIGEACPALVEHQHAAAVGETLDVADEQRLLPGREQISSDPTN